VEEPLKGLIKILLFGFLGFMIIALVQEWKYFSTAWFGRPQPAAELSDERKQAAGDAVHLTLNLMRHLYSSGGDPRFAERIPASESIVGEILADVEYLARNHRRQDPELLRLEITGVVPLDERRVEVRTREFWTIRWFWIDGSGEAEPATSQVIGSRYLVVHGGTGWRVEDWEFLDEPQPPADGPDS